MITRTSGGAGREQEVAAARGGRRRSVEGTKRFLIVVLAVIAVSVGVDQLGDLTQDRADHVARDSRSEIVFDVSSRDRTGSALVSARGLWGACQGTVHQDIVEPGVVETGDGHFRLVTKPALGEHAWRRLQGCLEDTTLDRVKAHVLAKRDLAPASQDPVP